MKWIKDEAFEADAKANKLFFDVEDCKVSDIDVEGSLDNHARMDGQLDQERVQAMKVASGKGIPFPMIVLLRRKKQKDFVCGGNHRLGCVLELGDPIIPAYVVKTEDTRIFDMLPRWLNVWNGHPLSNDEKLSHAMYEIEQYNTKAAEVARRFLLSPGAIQEEIRKREMVSKASKMGIDLTKLKKSNITKLFRFKDNDNLFSSVARAFLKVPVGSIDDLVNGIKSEKTEATKLAACETLTSEFSTPAKSYQSHNMQPRTKLRRFLAIGENLIPNGKTKLGHFQITEPEEIKKEKERCHALGKKLLKL